MHAESDKFVIGRRDLTAAMMTDWKMPQLLIDAVSFYDHPEAAGFNAGSRQLKLAIALQMADQLASMCISPDDTSAEMMPRIYETGAKLDLSVDQVISIANQAAKDWVGWGRLLNLKTKAVPPIVPVNKVDS